MPLHDACPPVHLHVGQDFDGEDSEEVPGTIPHPPSGPPEDPLSLSQPTRSSPVAAAAAGDRGAIAAGSPGSPIMTAQAAPSPGQPDHPGSPSAEQQPACSQPFSPVSGPAGGDRDGDAMDDDTAATNWQRGKPGPACPDPKTNYRPSLTKCAVIGEGMFQQMDYGHPGRSLYLGGSSNNLFTHQCTYKDGSGVTCNKLMYLSQLKSGDYESARFATGKLGPHMAKVHQHVVPHGKAANSALAKVRMMASAPGVGTGSATARLKRKLGGGDPNFFVTLGSVRIGVSTNERAMCAQARWYIYSENCVSKNTFSSEYFKDMMIQNGATAVLHKDALVGYVSCEHTIYSIMAGIFMEENYEFHGGYPFSQVLPLFHHVTLCCPSRAVLLFSVHCLAVPSRWRDLGQPAQIHRGLRSSLGPRCGLDERNAVHRCARCVSVPC